MLYIIFLVIGISSGIGQFFIEKGFIRKFLAGISLISFVGLGWLSYIDRVNSDQIQERLRASEASSSLLETQTTQLKNQIASTTDQLAKTQSQLKNNLIYDKNGIVVAQVPPNSNLSGGLE